MAFLTLPSPNALPVLRIRVVGSTVLGVGGGSPLPLQSVPNCFSELLPVLPKVLTGIPPSRVEAGQDESKHEDGPNGQDHDG